MSRNPHFHNLSPNEELRNLKVSLSSKDYQNFEEAIVSRRFQEPIIAWKRIIIDGYKRYDICLKHNIRLRTRSINFQYMEEAICWICKHELERENLTEAYTKYYIGKYYQAKRDLFAKKYPVQNINACYESTRPPLDKAGNKRNYTTFVVADELKISCGSICSYSVYARNIDSIKKKSLQIADIILNDTVRASLNAVSSLARLSDEDLSKILSFMLEPDTFRLHQTDIDRILNIRKQPARPVTKENEPEIKHIPKYDPDAEIASLTLTIPSWISSITRTQNAPSFPETTKKARQQLDLQLWNLQKTILTIQCKMKENLDE